MHKLACKHDYWILFSWIRSLSSFTPWLEMYQDISLGFAYGLKLITISCELNHFLCKSFICYRGTLPSLISLFSLVCMLYYHDWFILLSLISMLLYPCFMIWMKCILFILWDYCLWINSFVLWRCLTCYWVTFFFPFLVKFFECE